MSRADLHNAVAIDRDIFEASRVDPTLADPVVRIEGGLPGVARPFVVVRDYQGPQGAYIERFALRDDSGRTVAESAIRRIELDGEMFENRFTNTLSGVLIDSPDEHELVFFLGDDEVGSIPVFFELGIGANPRVAAQEAFNKALQKGSILWVSVPQPRNGTRRAADHQPAWHTQPIWYIFEGGKLYVFNGPTEQNVPNLEHAQEVRLIARSKEVRSRVSEVPASVRILRPDDPLWEKMEKTALIRRLNLPDGDGAAERWRQNCVLVELTPRFGSDTAPVRAAAAPAAAASAAGAATAEAAAAPAARAEDEIKVEAQIDQAVYDQLIGEGKPERVARAKAKAAYVRAEKERLRSEQPAS